jgi:hypothetical protein
LEPRSATLSCYGDTLTSKRDKSFQRLGTAQVDGKVIHWRNCNGDKADYNANEYVIDKGNDCDIRASAALPQTGSQLPLIGMTGLDVYSRRPVALEPEMEENQGGINRVLGDEVQFAALQLLAA